LWIGCLPWDWRGCLRDSQEHSQRDNFHGGKAIVPPWQLNPPSPRFFAVYCGPGALAP
jgi:hypothetical protein